MPTAAPADPSTRRLSEVARHVVIPVGIVDTLWFEVEEQCREWGDEFDVWQDGLGQLALGLREDGTFAATVGGVVLSIPRQVAKTFIVGRIVFALAALYPNLTILWTAHRIRTATQTFEKLKALAKRPSVRPYMLDNAAGGIRSVNGEQEFQFANGSKIMFGAREQGFGRGFDEVDIEVFDEAQILTEKALEDMVAATNQSRFQYGALLFFMGTPPRPNDPGEEFRNRRTEALSLKPADQPVGAGEDMLYVECSADPRTGRAGGPSIDDLEQVARANPSYPHRTPLMSIKRLWKNLTSEGSKRREGLGIWDEPDEKPDSPIDLTKWSTMKGDADPDVLRRCVLTIDVEPSRLKSSIGIAARVDDKPLVMVRTGAGTTWLAPAIASLVAARDIAEVVLSPTALFLMPAVIKALEGTGVEVDSMSIGDTAQACAAFQEAAKNEALIHLGQPQLDAAVVNARVRPRSEGEIWDRRDRSIDISPLVAVSNGMWRLSSAVVAEPTVFFV